MDLEPRDLLRFEIVDKLAERFGLKPARVDGLLRAYGLRESRAKARRSTPKGIGSPSIYVVAAHMSAYASENLIRVGYSAWPHVRFAEIQDASPVKVELFGVYPQARAQRIEEDLQHALRPESHHGEWLRFTPRVRALLARIERMSVSAARLR